MNDIEVSIACPIHIINMTETQYKIETLDSGSNAVVEFLFWPQTSGNYSIDVEIRAIDPGLYHKSMHAVSVVPRISKQVHIAQTLLDLGVYTNNDTLIDAAKKVGNWLETSGTSMGSFRAWNADPTFTDYLVPGCFLATEETGMFFLNLFRATGEFNYLVDALDAASFLGDPTAGAMLQVGDAITWSQYNSGLMEAAKIAEFLLEINKELIFGYFNSTIDGVSNYLSYSADVDGYTMNWIESSGLTEAAAKYFTFFEYTKDYSIWAGNWLSNQITYGTWLYDLPLSLKSDDPCLLYTDLGLAGICNILSYLNFVVNLPCDEQIQQICERIISRAYLTSQGTNWDYNSWPESISNLANSASWNTGTAGIASALVAAYRVTGNQTYLDYALEASTWMMNCLSAFEDNIEVSLGTLADIIDSCMDIHSVLPVISVGYFVDPMTSLSGGMFELSGYVQTLGWHAKDLELTIDIPSSLRIFDQSPTIAVGSISSPGARIVTWNVTPLAYGVFQIEIEGTSSNAGIQSANASLSVTDLGVTKLEENPMGYTALSLAEETEDLYNLGETVWLPIEAEYYNGDPAINATIKVGDIGSAIVNDSGYAYIGVTSVDPETIDIPIYIRYDKKSGITSGTNNISVSLTFTGLEVYDITCSANETYTGEPVTFSGYVRYAHDHSIVPEASVAIDGVVKTLTDEIGFFTFQYTQSSTGLWNHTITAESDSEQRITICALSQVVQINWLEFWTPLTMGLVIGSGAIIVSVVSIILWKFGKRFRSNRVLAGQTQKNLKQP